MKVSVIIPVYNVEPYIERCLLSVLNQTHQDIEIIVVDDCGQDNSISVAQEIINNHTNGYKVRVLNHEHNRGLSAARNTGTKEAAGKYVYYLDSDDEITPNCIETLVALVKKYPEAEMVQGNTQTIPEPVKNKDWRNIRYKNYPEYVTDNDWIRQHFYANNNMKNIPMNATNKLTKHKFIIDNGLFFKEGIIYEDELWMFFAVKKINFIAFTTEYTYLAYRREGSIIQSRNTYKSIESRYIILEEVFSNIDLAYAKEQQGKYLFLISGNIKRINLANSKEKEFYAKYRSFIKNLLKNISDNDRWLMLPLGYLLLPKFFIKVKIFEMIIQISK